MGELIEYWFLGMIVGLPLMLIMLGFNHWLENTENKVSQFIAVLGMCITLIIAFIAGFSILAEAIK